MPPAHNVTPLTRDQQKLVIDNLWFVEWMVTQFAATHHNVQRHRDDLEQAGHIALIAAARGFDPKLGFQLCTYAQRGVLKAVRDEWRRLTEAIHRPRQCVDGHVELAPPLAPHDLEWLGWQRGEGADPERRIDAERLHAKALTHLARFGHDATAFRTAGMFLNMVTQDEAPAQEDATLFGVTRERVRQLRERGQGYFNKWSEQIRRETERYK